MKHQRGMTLIELMITLALIAILIGLAAPSMKHMIDSNAVSSSVNSFMADLRYARSEAIRRSSTVVMCRSENPNTTPTCGTGTGAAGKGWKSGWIIFEETGTNNAYDSGTDRLLRVQGPVGGIDEIIDTPNSTKFILTATGRMQATTSAATVLFGSTSYNASTRRTVCVGVGGRARVAGDANAAC